MGIQLSNDSFSLDAAGDREKKKKRATCVNAQVKIPKFTRLKNVERKQKIKKQKIESSYKKEARTDGSGMLHMDVQTRRRKRLLPQKS